MRHALPAALTVLMLTTAAGPASAEYYLWVGLFVPAATPAPAVETLRAAVRKVVALPAYREDMEKVRVPISYLDRPEFAAFWKKDAEAMVSLARKIGRVQ